MAVANKWLNETTALVWDINIETDLLTSLSYRTILVDTILTPTSQFAEL